MVRTPPNEMTLRPARPDDVPALVALEEATFDYDRLSRRSFQYMQSRAHASLLVAHREGAPAELLGYSLVLFRRGTTLARLYSIAVSERARGTGLGARLLDAAERDAESRGAAYLRLEVRADNARAIGLYEGRGYHEIQRVPGYYGELGDALRFEKRIRHPDLTSHVRDVPYYEQTTEFTCGAASLMMAMAAQDPSYAPSEREELQIWREATTIFMTSGHGGCSPHGLALAAHARGMRPRIHVTQSGPLFLDGVRDEEKKRVIRVVHESFEASLAARRIPVRRGALSIARVRRLLDEGHALVMLISEYRMTRRKAPHWVVLTGHDDRYIYFHDPAGGDDEHASDADFVNLPVRHEDFERMARHGRSKLRATVDLAPLGDADEATE